MFKPFMVVDVVHGVVCVKIMARLVDAVTAVLLAVVAARLLW